MAYLWDYNEKELRKTERGRIFILERMLNYDPDGKKIKLSEVKKTLAGDRSQSFNHPSPTFGAFNMGKISILTQEQKN